MNYFQQKNNGPSSFFGNNGNSRPSFFSRNNEPNQGTSNSDTGGFFNRSRGGALGNSASFGNENTTGNGTFNGGQDTFFNRNLQSNTNSYFTNPQSNNQNRADDNLGTFAVRYKDTLSTHKECLGNYVCCITAMKEYESQKTSIFRKRCEDYLLLKDAKVPNDNFLLGILKNYAMNEHINPKFIDPQLVEAIKNSAHQASNTDQPNQGFQSANSFFGRNNRGMAISSGAENNNNNNGKPNPFSGQSNNLSGNPFGMRNNQQDVQGGNANTNSFFTRNNQTAGFLGSQGGNGFGQQNRSNSQPTLNSFFQSQPNAPTGQNSNSFFNPGSQTRGSVFGQQNGQNQNANASGFQNFFSNGPNANANQRNGFTNQGPGQGSFFNPSNQGGNTQGNSFFRNQNSGPQSFFSNAQGGANSFAKPNQLGPMFQNNNNNTGNAIDANLFGVPNPTGQYPPAFGMTNFYGPYPYPSPYAYNPYMPDFNSSLMYPMPISLAQAHQNKILESKAWSDFLGPKDLLGIGDQDKMEKNIDKGIADELKRQMQEMERQNYVMERYINAIKEEHEDYALEPPARAYKLPNIIRKHQDFKLLSNQSFVKSKGHSSLTNQNESRSFLSSKGNPAFAKDSTMFKDVTKQTDSDTSNKIIALKIVAAYEDYPIFFEELKINKYKTIKDLKHYLVSKIPKFSYPEDDLFCNSQIMIDNNPLNDALRLKDIEDIEDKDILMKIALKSNVGNFSERINKSLKNSPFSSKKNAPANFDSQLEKVSPAKDLCSLKSLPILTKPGYTLKPSLIQLSRMTDEELHNVEDLVISNEFGEIKWPGKTDVTGINFDLWVIIKKDAVEVYPDDLFDEISKPDRGCKLNRPAEITLRNIFPKNEKIKDNFAQKLQALCEKQDAKFLHYDEENGIWKFKVFHFTIYAFQDFENTDENLDDNESEQNVEFEVRHKKVGTVDSRSERIREEKQPSNVFGNDNIRHNLSNQNPNLMLESLDKEDQALEESSRRIVDKPKADFKNKKINTNQSFKYLLKDSNQDNFIPEQMDDAEVDLEREYQQHHIEHASHNQNFKAYVAEKIQQKIQETNAMMNAYKASNIKLLKEHKSKKFLSTDNEILNKAILLNKINSQDKLWPSENPSLNEFYNEFNFGLGWLSNGRPYMVDAKNDFKVSRHNFANYCKVEKGFLSLLRESFLSLRSQTGQASTSENFSPASERIALLMLIYQDLTKNKSPVSKSLQKEAAAVIRLVLDLFVLPNVKLEEFLKTPNFISEVSNQLKTRSMFFKDEHELYNATLRRKLYLWIERLYADDHSTKALPSQPMINSLNESFSSGLANKFDVSSFHNLSESIFKRTPHDPHSGYIWSFFHFMQEDVNRAKSVEELFSSFQSSHQAQPQKPLDVIFESLLQIYLNAHQYLKTEVTSASLVSPIPKVSANNNELQILNLVILLTLQSVHQFDKFREFFVYAYKTVQETLIQNHEYFIALEFAELAKYFMDSSAFNSEVQKLLSLHYVTDVDIETSNKNNFYIKQYWRQSVDLGVQLLKNIKRNNTFKAIKNAQALRGNVHPQEFLFESITPAQLEKCFASDKDLQSLIALFDQVEGSTPMPSSRVLAVVYAYLQFLKDWRYQTLTEESLHSYNDTIFEGITLLSKEDLNPKAIEMLKVICNILLAIMADKDFWLDEYVEKIFVPRYLNGEYTFMIEDAQKKALIGKWICKLK